MKIVNRSFVKKAACVFGGLVAAAAGGFGIATYIQHKEPVTVIDETSAPAKEEKVTSEEGES